MRRGGRAAVIPGGRRAADGCRPQPLEAVPVAVAALEGTASSQALYILGAGPLSCKAGPCSLNEVLSVPQLQHIR